MSESLQMLAQKRPVSWLSLANSYCKLPVEFQRKLHQSMIDTHESTEQQLVSSLSEPEVSVEVFEGMLKRRDIISQILATIRQEIEIVEPSEREEYQTSSTASSSVSSYLKHVEAGTQSTKSANAIISTSQASTGCGSSMVSMPYVCVQGQDLGIQLVCLLLIMPRPNFNHIHSGALSLPGIPTQLRPVTYAKRIYSTGSFEQHWLPFKAQIFSIQPGCT